MTAVRSRKYVDGSRGQSCLLRIVGVCTGGGEDTIFAHIRDCHTGRAAKASDLSGGDACFACHEVFDRRAKMPDGNLIGDDEWRIYALRALQETIERRHGQGLLFVGEDAVKRFSERQAKPRKSPEQRTKIPSRPFPEQHRPLRSRTIIRTSEKS